ncbi:MAG: tRNA (adenine-N1)-methyltransferase [Thaumarchaeota archaeon]|jgi:tRNA (adenine57-N1/adenine58-N1)-methyltransferase|nr:tRNA (adenine-N1)-methyltransferase [Candidatus Geocrenenecus arthurdayi]MCL7388409.1 tRNA (adenine-N1)-methyltransferase [Candidatus Geocrenenecus arthurdayi]MCL7390737.1 tRNA (adenine-N1)-methyltransferase [Candidatus Geocrenenecus arthurdayi]MCL7395807.1 tRNA (adenine-N1)-methyltransferase [Candidatus Geocrenenecus arthurdayi]MCL7404098.1 tRNA (adenine-N1)-methyltransferase [Candidatus Geocrenenecus arthurdayi]
METINEGSTVLFITEKKKKYMVRISRGRRYHTSEGYVDLSELIGKRYGCRIKSNTGSTWTVLKPTILDYVLHYPRLTQIVYPKDLGYIILISGVRSGSRVVEAGTGSGVLTTILASYVAPTGKVYSYDVQEEYLENARRNLEKLGLLDYVELKHGSVEESVEERDVDAFILDVPEPWKAVKPAYNALKDSGIFISISPTIEQVVETVETLRIEGFDDISTVEILLREMRVKKGMTRPVHLMHAHTCYITSARKTLKEE